MIPHFVDTHCHLEPEDFRGPEGADERFEVMRRAAMAGVGQLIVIGSGRGAAEVENAVALARAHRHVYAAIGVHPHDAKALVGLDGGEVFGGAALWDEICRLACTEPRVVAVGETGLDFHYKNSTPEQQRTLTRRFLRLGHEAGKPVSLHIRDAHDEARALVREAHADGAAPPGGVVHCFTGTADDARAWVDLGFYISLSGIVTFKSAGQIQEAARIVPSDRLLLETDCPYLAPVPLRGRRNEPANLVHTAAFVAALRGVETAQLATETSAAARRLFGISEQADTSPLT